MMIYLDLGNILEVEEFIKADCCKAELTIFNLHDKIPVELSNEEFDAMLNYLQEEKIIVDNDGEISWVYNPEGVDYYMNHPELHWEGNDEN